MILDTCNYLITISISHLSQRIKRKKFAPRTQKQKAMVVVDTTESCLVGVLVIRWLLMIGGRCSWLLAAGGKTRVYRL